MRRYIYIFIILAAALLSVSCKPTAVALPDAARSYGEHSVSSVKPGKIIGLIAEKGERISAGQPLFAIADERMEADFNELTTLIAKEEAGLKAMQTAAPVNNTANLPALQAQLQAAQQKAAKMNNLYAIGGVSRNQAQAAQQELQQAMQALQAASGQTASQAPASPEAIEQQQQLLASLKEKQILMQAQRQANEITCPLTGVVKEVLVRNGDVVTANQPVLILEVTENKS